MSVLSRRRIITKIAQQGMPATTTPTPVSGAPVPVVVVSYFPSINLGWGSENVPRIQQITNILNSTIFILSQGQMDLDKFRQQYFNVLPTQIPDQILAAVVRYARLFYLIVLTNGGANHQYTAALTPEDKATRVRRLYDALSATPTDIPDGAINSQLNAQIGGNIKTIIASILATIK